MSKPREKPPRTAETKSRLGWLDKREAKRETLTGVTIPGGRGQNLGGTPSGSITCMPWVVPMTEGAPVRPRAVDLTRSTVVIGKAVSRPLSLGGKKGWHVVTRGGCGGGLGGELTGSTGKVTGHTCWTRPGQVAGLSTRKTNRP